MNSDFPKRLHLSFPRGRVLRYGENPHQAAALYGDFDRYFSQLGGKLLSYNNLLDVAAGVSLIADFDLSPPTIAIFKHTNPCGVGQDVSLCRAWEKAFATDRQSPFGSIIVSNTKMNIACAKVICEIFSEVIVAPDFEKEAIEILSRKKNLRLLKMLKPIDHSDHHDHFDHSGELQFRSIGSGMILAQRSEGASFSESDFEIVSKRAPNADELAGMKFGWRVVKHVKSNAIVYAKADRTIGIGAGQMSRVDASHIAIWKAGEAGLSLRGSAVCSEAFFPFADGLIAAAKAGATAAIAPRGSLRDREVIDAANKEGMAMIFTGKRHFRH